MNTSKMRQEVQELYNVTRAKALDIIKVEAINILKKYGNRGASDCLDEFVFSAGGFHFTKEYPDSYWDRYLEWDEEDAPCEVVALHEFVEAWSPYLQLGGSEVSMRFSLEVAECQKP